MAEIGAHEEKSTAFTGLNITSELGTITLPEGAKIAQLSGEVLTHRSFFDKVADKPASTHIDTSKLQGVLIKTQGAVLFQGVDDRLIVLARVGDIHLPFYRSAFGTSGKARGEWYPFFGFSDKWLIKGSTEESEEGYHNDKIERVRNILNHNLRLPLMPWRLDDKGMLRLQNDTNDEYFDINTLLPFQMIEKSTDYVKEDEAIRRITGYNPAPEIGPNYKTGNNLSFEWREAVLSQIG